MDHQELFENYLNLSYRYLAIRNRSVKELEDYLAKKKASEEIIDKVVHCLTEKQFLNDEAFAKSWILSRARSKPKGKILLQIELRQKGIGEEIIKKVLQEAQEEIPDELEQAKKLIAKRMQQIAGKKRQEIYQKVGGFLARRGYNWEIVKKAIDSYL